MGGTLTPSATIRTLNRIGLLGPGLTIRAEIMPEIVTVGIRFEVLGKRFIKYENIQINKMCAHEEIHTHIFTHDTRLLPYESYQEIEQRPCPQHTLLDFLLKDGLEARWQEESVITAVTGAQYFQGVEIEYSLRMR
jgi:hypothetical protein